MIPKAAIEKAIEGGWKPVAFIPVHVEVDEVTPEGVWFHEIITREKRLQRRRKKEPYSWQLFFEEIALDAEFWSSLGKILEWRACFRGCNEIDGSDWCGGFHKPTWRVKASDFYDLVLTGGDTQKFWDELLKV